MNKQRMLKSLFILGILFTFVTLSSCKREGCTDSIAENFESKAKKDDGSCIYPRDKFLGSFSVNETCSSGTDSYTITITASSANKTNIIIGNMYGVNAAVTATVSGSTISFNDTQNGINYSGSGTLNGSSLTINVTVSAGGVSDICTMNCIKQ
jgi:hypothetical protein